ncbi:unnamed protein product [Fraxinus pennsylvanica]|uniref:Probable N-acetyl-gamma-glutamyl-phosphate reductase, chloroplastic n=1 Tax=Fraxinus pennsylvanica TaxID=56036 RepID=A0AAD2A599_9LAMI|nr:unnamed protein product [Fraxinus pennsylvanica]
MCRYLEFHYKNCVIIFLLHFIIKDLPDMVAVKDADFSNVDAVFCCLPHGTTQEIIKGLPSNLKIVDLSADFRLRDVGEYEEWYGQPHKAQDLQKEAVYGLTEISRREIQNARLVANPGCYPTSIQLPLIPLIKAKLIEVRNIIIDSKSGVSGAGRGAKEANLYTEIAEGIHSYGITRHRHVPEIEQGLSDAANSEVTVSFTPHLMPMSRGMQSTIYVEMAPGVSIQDLYQHLSSFYENEEFVTLLKKNEVPHTRHVRGSNYCFMNVFPDRIPGRAIIISVIDNLVKGASEYRAPLHAFVSLILCKVITSNFTSREAIHFSARKKYMAHKLNAPVFCGLKIIKNLPSYSRLSSCTLSLERNGICRASPKVQCVMNMVSGESDEPGKLRLEYVLDKSIKLWDNAPESIKSFPWNKASENFIQLILDLVLAVVKFLSIPVFTITSISEMSYCAHERKLYLIPLPFLVGIAVAGVLREAAVASSPSLKNAEVPWHLIAIAIFFTLLKLPGPNKYLNRPGEEVGSRYFEMHI